MFRLRDPEASAMLAEMRERHRAGLFPEPNSEAVPYTQPSMRCGGRKACKAMKKVIWAEAAKARKPRKPKPSKPRKEPPSFDYAAWARHLAGYLAEPRSLDELAERYGVSPGGLRIRLHRARHRGCWPPAGMCTRWVRQGTNARRLALEADGA